MRPRAHFRPGLGAAEGKEWLWRDPPLGGVPSHPGLWEPGTRDKKAFPDPHPRQAGRSPGGRERGGWAPAGTETPAGGAPCRPWGAREPAYRLARARRTHSSAPAERGFLRPGPTIPRGTVRAPGQGEAGRQAPVGGTASGPPAVGAGRLASRSEGVARPGPPPVLPAGSPPRRRALGASSSRGLTPARRVRLHVDST